MKFELKTENENYLKSFSNIFKTTFILALVIILFDVGLKLGIISRYYQIDYNCRLLSVEKSKSHLKILSNLLDLKNKQKIWDFCKEVIK